MTGATESMSVRKGKWVTAAEKEPGQREVTEQNSAGVKLGGRAASTCRRLLDSYHVCFRKSDLCMPEPSI